MQAVTDQTSIIGQIAFNNFLIDSPRAREIDALLRNARDITSDRWYALMRELSLLCSIRSTRRRNLVVLTGREVIARRLIGDLTYSGTINYGALGTDDTAVDAGDTALGAEAARKLFARRSRTNAQVNFDFFYSQADTDGTYEEFGLFIDGEDSADSGQLFNHVLTGGWAKTDTEAMTVSVTLNVNAS